MVKANLIDLAGQRFGMLLVIEPGVPYRAPNGKNVQRTWLCKCDCGTMKTVIVYSLLRKLSQSCGCQQHRTGEENPAFKHGETLQGKTTPEFRSWTSLLGRCTNPRNAKYPIYGGHPTRPVTVCARWLSDDGFINFLADVGLRPGPGYSIDRFPDPFGNYEPSNVRWATAKEQGRNKRNNHLLTFQGETLCISAWTERLGFNRDTIHNRLHYGWSVENTLSTPLRPHRPYRRRS